MVLPFFIRVQCQIFTSFEYQFKMEFFSTIRLQYFLNILTIRTFFLNGIIRPLNDMIKK